jgi:D-alanine-D-alanine ligase-like ATP-grasp enzyme
MALDETYAIAGFGPQWVVPLAYRETARAPPKTTLPHRVMARRRRYAVSVDADVTVPRVALAADVAERSLRLTEALGLLVAGIDLRPATDGSWYCFEVNPCPGFT